MENDDRPRIQPWSLWLIAAVMAGGILVAWAYVERNRYEAANPRPHYITKIEEDIELTDHQGELVRLGQLKDKVWTAYLTLDEPTPESRAVTEQLRDVAEAFPETAGQLMFAGFQVGPGAGSPGELQALRSALGIDRPGWLTLREREEPLMIFLRRFMRFLPLRERAAREDDPGTKTRWEYDTRIVVVDGKANVRGYYQLLHPERAEFEKARLIDDLRYLLDEAKP